MFIASFAFFPSNYKYNIFEPTFYQINKLIKVYIEFPYDLMRFVWWGTFAKIVYPSSLCTRSTRFSKYFLDQGSKIHEIFKKAENYPLILLQKRRFYRQMHENFTNSAFEEMKYIKSFFYLLGIREIDERFLWVHLGVFQKTLKLLPSLLWRGRLEEFRQHSCESFVEFCC